MLLVTLAPSLLAQRRAQLDVVPPSAGGAPVVSATNLFADADMRDLMRSGFPASLHYRVELWRSGGIFNELEGREEWEVIVQYDPSEQRYRVLRREGKRVDEVGSFATLSTAQAVIERPQRVNLLPERAGTKYYYTLSLEIQALSVSDMDQLGRWLRGVRSGGTAASALGNGVRTLMLRMLGGENRHFDARSPVFIPVP